MRKLVIFCTVVVAFLSYRAYIVINRPLPEDIKQPNVVKILDELGRIANFFVSIKCM